MLKNFFMILIILVIIDLPMIMIINNKMYSDMFYNINKAEIKMNTIKIILFMIEYLFIAFTIYYFVDQPFKSFLLGLSIYSIYNLTNYITINNYSPLVLIVDSLWGGCLFYITYYIYLKLKKYII